MHKTQAASSFQCVDELVHALFNTTAFPALEKIVILGFSGGGQFVNRYSWATDIGLEPASTNSNGSVHIHASDTGDSNLSNDIGIGTDSGVKSLRRRGEILAPGEDEDDNAHDGTSGKVKLADNTMLYNNNKNSNAAVADGDGDDDGDEGDGVIDKYMHDRDDRLVSFIVGSCNSFLYLTPARPHLNCSLYHNALPDCEKRFSVPLNYTRGRCPGYNDWQFGLDNLPLSANSYLQPVTSNATLGDIKTDRLKRKNVRFIFGAADVCNCNLLNFSNDDKLCYPKKHTCRPNRRGSPGCCDTSDQINLVGNRCEDRLQGPSRLQRGVLYMQYLAHLWSVTRRVRVYETAPPTQSPQTIASISVSPVDKRRLLSSYNHTHSNISRTIRNNTIHHTYTHVYTPYTPTYDIVDGMHHDSQQFFRSPALQKWVFGSIV
jgi:hypothetical protein